MINLKAQVAEAVAEQRPLLLPGAYDALSARLVEAAGFPAIYLTGAGFANASLGVPDIGLVTVTELRDHVARVANVVEIPVIVDIDTGFGNPINMIRTVQLLEQAGASAIQVEDQTFPKKCGHFDGKDVIPAAEMVAKIEAAVDTRSSDDFLIIARTDARAVAGLDEAIERGLRYQEAGADAIFVEAPQTIEELRLIGGQISGPLVANMVEGGLTPLLGADELSAAGFDFILMANAALRVAHRAVAELLAEIARSGSTRSYVDRMTTWEERQEGVGKSAFDALELKYATRTVL